MLSLPREISLLTTSYLEPIELTSLASVNRDHYLAVQEPLYARTKLTTYASLINLVDTLRKVPVVSTISPQQRLRWHRLSDAQLRERDIKHLDVVLDSVKDGTRITGAVLSSLIGAIARKCYNVCITLTLNGVWPGFVEQLQQTGVPNVRRLSVYLGATTQTLDFASQKRWSADFYELVFAGQTFSDLKSVYVNTSDTSGDPPKSLHDSVSFAHRLSPDLDSDWTPKKPLTNPTPFYGLLKMEEIVLAHNKHLDLRVLDSLFGSTIIPKYLSRLELVDCPSLHPIKHLKALSTLLHRALQLVQHLRLHLCRLRDVDTTGETYLDTQHAARIAEHPEEHLCNIIRDLGQNIRSLDIAVPFACSNIFPPIRKRKILNTTVPDYPAIPIDPHSTLPTRLLTAGYKYRRLICWHGVGRSAHP